MAKNPADPTPPTMIIPRGTEIEVDQHGQLSVRAPGNLVIQNSGNYGNLISVHGSIRIEPNVEVEAVSVSCAETCYVQGNLTAWKVKAQCLHLEDTAQAHVVLQETERLEVGKGARLVGNFTSEKELFFLFSRFSQQVRSLPFYRGGQEAATTSALAAEARRVLAAGQADAEAPPRNVAEVPSPTEAATEEEDDGADSLALLAATDPEASQELPDPLFFSLVLLERDTSRNTYSAEAERVLAELIKLLRGRDLETLQHTYRTLFGRVRATSDMIQRAEELVDSFFQSRPAARPASA